MTTPKAVVWVLLAGLAVMGCFIVSLVAAAFLLPPDALMQAAFAVPVFLISGSACGAAMLRRAGAVVPKWIVALVLAVVLAIVVASIVLGLTTPGETALLASVLFTAALWGLWQRSFRGRRSPPATPEG
ncbi:hypothetical protein [Gymnodinialimonas sp. 57CJ19]|uniref:hypothetical protein n=1 Tax=Gymnodinialimonas sp. 57CJ19 TaxID=3138498 RepID=UPI0031342D22